MDLHSGADLCVNQAVKLKECLVCLAGERERERERERGSNIIDKVMRQDKIFTIGQTFTCRTES